MLFLLLVPFLYIGLCSGMTAVLPPVDYKAINQEQTTSPNPDSKSSDQIQIPAPDSQAKPAAKSPA